MSKRRSGGFSLASLLILACAVVMIVGFFLPILSSETGGTKININGIDTSKYAFEVEPSDKDAEKAVDNYAKSYVAKFEVMEQFNEANSTAFLIVKWGVLAIGGVALILAIFALITTIKPDMGAMLMKLLGLLAFACAAAVISCVIVLRCGGGVSDVISNVVKEASTLGMSAILIGIGGVGAFVFSLFKRR